MQAPLFRLDVRMEPFDIDCAACITISSQPLEINYSPETIRRILSFFVVPPVQESAKIAAWDTLQGIQDSTQATLIDLLYGDLKYLIHIDVSGPKLILPYGAEEGVFSVNLGEFHLENHLQDADEYYENFELQIANLEMVYTVNNEEFNIFPSFCINTEMNFMKAKYRKRKWEFKDSELTEYPDVIINGGIPCFRFVMAPSIYHKVLSLPKIFHFEDED